MDPRPIFRRSPFLCLTFQFEMRGAALTRALDRSLGDTPFRFSMTIQRHPRHGILKYFFGSRAKFDLYLGIPHSKQDVCSGRDLGVGRSWEIARRADRMTSTVSWVPCPVPKRGVQAISWS